jgi:hypothetical protein
LRIAEEKPAMSINPRYAIAMSRALQLSQQSRETTSAMVKLSEPSREQGNAMLNHRRPSGCRMSTSDSSAHRTRAYSSSSDSSFDDDMMAVEREGGSLSLWAT